MIYQENQRLLLLSENEIKFVSNVLYESRIPDPGKRERHYPEPEAKPEFELGYTATLGFLMALERRATGYTDASIDEQAEAKSILEKVKGEPLNFEKQTPKKLNRFKSAIEQMRKLRL